MVLERFYSQLTMADCMHSTQMLSMIAQSSEFENVAVREEELSELDRLMCDAAPFDARGGPENRHGKVSILLQVRPADDKYLHCTSSSILSLLYCSSHYAVRC